MRVRRVTLLGFTIPDAELRWILANDRRMPTQTHLFAWKVVAALQLAGAQVSLLSAMPVSQYPLCRRIVFPFRRFDENGASGQLLGFANLRIIKHVTRFLACMAVGFRRIREWRPDVLLVHGVHSTFLWWALLAKYLMRQRVVVILTDPPGVPLPEDSRLIKALRVLDTGLVKLALSRLDGVIALAPALAADLAPGRPSMIMEGIAAREILDQLDGACRNPYSDDPGCTLLYAGALEAEYGVDRLVDAVIAIPAGEKVCLRLYGRGTLSERLTHLAATNQRIQYGGALPHDALTRLYRHADALLQVRPAGQRVARYSFPSKLIEYLGTGVPVITTRLPSIPGEYRDAAFWLDDDSTDGIRDGLARFLSLPEQERREIGDRGRILASHRLTSDRQGKRVLEFLESLV